MVMVVSTAGLEGSFREIALAGAVGVAGTREEAGFHFDDLLEDFEVMPLPVKKVPKKTITRKEGREPVIRNTSPSRQKRK